MKFSEIVRLTSPTGATLAVRHEPAKGDARAIVQINHGLAEHAARYAQFADDLAAAGYHVYAHDHRGHGYTKAPGAPPRAFDLGGNGASLVLQDVAAVQAHAEAAHTGLPVVVFGHSMGGIISLAYGLQNARRLAGVASWNGSFAGAAASSAALAILRWEAFRLGSDAVSQALPKMTFQQWGKAVKDRRTEFDWLSHDPWIVDAYIEDPLCGWDASVSLWRDLFRLMALSRHPGDATPEAKSLPFHFVAGGEDPSNGGGKAVESQAKRMRDAGFSDVTLKTYPSARHETLNDTAAKTAVADFLDWLDKRGTAPASAAQ